MREGIKKFLILGDDNVVVVNSDQVYGTYSALSLEERIVLIRGILHLILKRFIGSDAIVVDGKGEEIKFYP